MVIFYFVYLAILTAITYYVGLTIISILMGITLFLSICCYAMESLNDWCEKQIKIVDTDNNKE